MSYVMSAGVREFLARNNGIHLDGKAMPGSSPQLTAIINPSNGKTLCEIHYANAADVDRAAQSARRAFDDGRWRLKPPAEKSRILLKVAELMEAHADELAELEMLDAGKLHRAARGAEVPFAAECFRYHAGWCTKIEGSTKQMSLAPVGGFHVYTQREPIGVVGLIVPSNGPLVQASWKLAPALAAGCCCVIKPDEKTPLSTLRLAELITEAGIPDGVVNLVSGLGQEVGAAMVSHPAIAKISFTGSTATGKSIGNVALHDMKKLTLELGGKSPVIILRDANLEQAIPGAAEAIFSNAGQVCVAGSRLYVEAPVYEEVIDGIISYAEKLVVGPADEPASSMGPLISEAHLESVLRAVALARKQGAKVASGGDRLRDGAGYFMSPTIMQDVQPFMPLVQEEIFGPVLAVSKIADLQEGLSLSNDSQFGLAASIWTENLSKAHRFAGAIRAGLVWINCHGIPDMAVPFGGYKQSGWGRENGYEGLLGFTELKSVVCKL